MANFKNVCQMLPGPAFFLIYKLTINYYLLINI